MINVQNSNKVQLKNDQKSNKKFDLED